MRLENSVSLMILGRSPESRRALPREPGKNGSSDQPQEDRLDWRESWVPTNKAFLQVKAALQTVAACPRARDKIEPAAPRDARARKSSAESSSGRWQAYGCL
jgi:hypothetical protein